MKPYHVFQILLLLLMTVGNSSSQYHVDGGIVGDEEEQRLWFRCLEEQEKLNKSGYVYADSALTAYVNNVLQKLSEQSPGPRTIRFRAIVLKNPLLNAFAYPNGVLYIHTGILAKMENESQLAILLGHEMSHALFKHTLNSIHNVQTTASVLSILQIATMLPFGYGGIANIFGNIGGLAAVSGYSKESERQADTSGLGLMARAGYNVREAPKIFMRLEKDVEEQNTKEPFFFGSHPKLNDRIHNLAELVETRFSSFLSTSGTERLNTILQSVILENAVLDLSMGRFSSARKAACTVLETDSVSAKAMFLLGEYYRQRNRGMTSDCDSALAEYSRAISHDSTFAHSFKAKGLLLYKRGEKEEAARYFAEYLRLHPDAEDKKYIEFYMNNK